MVRVGWRQNRAGRVNSMTEDALAFPIVLNDHQSSRRPLIEIKNGPRGNDPDRIVRRSGGHVRVVRHRPAAAPRGGRPYGCAQRNSGGGFAILIGSASRHVAPGRSGSRNRHGGRVDCRAGRVNGDRKPGTSGVVRGKDQRIPRLDVLRPTRFWIRCSKLDCGRPARALCRNVVRIETRAHASLISLYRQVTPVTRLGGWWIMPVSPM